MVMSKNRTRWQKAFIPVEYLVSVCLVVIPIGTHILVLRVQSSNPKTLSYKKKEKEIYENLKNNVWPTTAVFELLLVDALKKNRKYYIQVFVQEYFQEITHCKGNP